MEPNKILEEWERKLGVMSMALDRFGCGCWPEEIPPPTSPEDFLAWIEDEAEFQREQYEIEKDTFNEADLRLAYANELEEAAGELRKAGILPNKLPWEL